MHVHERVLKNMRRILLPTLALPLLTNPSFFFCFVFLVHDLSRSLSLSRALSRSLALCLSLFGTRALRPSVRPSVPRARTLALECEGSDTVVLVLALVLAWVLMILLAVMKMM